MKKKDTRISIVIIIILIFILLAAILFTNYYYGKVFKTCKECQPNEIFFVDVPLLPQFDIAKLESAMKGDGTHLDPNKNFNSAQGKKLNYNQLPPEIQQFYVNESIRSAVSNAIGEQVGYADEKERYRIFAIMYEDENDFKDWHYDNNFTDGNRYTLVIPIIVDQGNTSEFVIQERTTSEMKTVPIPLGKGVVYNGSITYHMVTKQTRGKRRLVIVVPMYSQYTKTIWGELRQTIRNVTNDVLTL